MFQTGVFGLGYYTDTVALGTPDNVSAGADAAGSGIASSEIQVPTPSSNDQEAEAAGAKVAQQNSVPVASASSGTASSPKAAGSSSTMSESCQDLNTGSAQNMAETGDKSEPAVTEDIEIIPQAEVSTAVDAGQQDSTCAASALSDLRAEESTQAETSPEATAPESSESGKADQRPRRYWGQALQYLEKSADVTKGAPKALPAP